MADELTRERCLHCLIVDEIIRRHADGGCTVALLGKVIEAAADVISMSPSLAQREKIIGDCVSELRSTVDAYVAKRLQVDADFRDRSRQSAS